MRKIKKIKEPSSAVVSFRIPHPVKHILNRIAEARGVSVQTVIRDTIYYWIDKMLLANIENDEKVVKEDVVKAGKTGKVGGIAKTKSNPTGITSNIYNQSLLVELEHVSHPIPSDIYDIFEGLPIEIVEEYVHESVVHSEKIEKVKVEKGGKVENGEKSGWQD